MPKTLHLEGDLRCHSNFCIFERKNEPQRRWNKSVGTEMEPVIIVPVVQLRVSFFLFLSKFYFCIFLYEIYIYMIKKFKNYKTILNSPIPFLHHPILLFGRQQCYQFCKYMQMSINTYVAIPLL